MVDLSQLPFGGKRNFDRRLVNPGTDLATSAGTVNDGESRSFTAPDANDSILRIWLILDLLDEIMPRRC